METAADNLFAAILSDGEIILWQGQPHRDSYLKGQKRQFALIIFWTLAFLCFASLLPKMGLGLNPVHWQFVVADLVLLAVCAWIFRWELRKNEVPDWHYAVTDQRILFRYPGEDEILTKQLSYAEIKGVHLRPHGNNISTIIFSPTFFAPSKVLFRYVADAAEVQEWVVSGLLVQAAKRTRE